MVIDAAADWPSRNLLSSGNVPDLHIWLQTDRVGGCPWDHTPLMVPDGTAPCPEYVSVSLTETPTIGIHNTP